jgi:GntR family transcriptional regulator
MIDRESGTPLYQQLAAIIRARIQDGTYPVGKLLPSESYLQQEYGLARDTVRAALDVLREEGRVVTYPERGSAVADLPRAAQNGT